MQHIGEHEHIAFGFGTRLASTFQLCKQTKGRIKALAHEEF